MKDDKIGPGINNLCKIVSNFVVVTSLYGCRKGSVNRCGWKVKGAEEGWVISVVSLGLNHTHFPPAFLKLKFVTQNKNKTFKISQ